MACCGANWLRSRASDQGNHLMKMQLDLPVEYPAHPLYQASRFMVRFADADDLLQGSPRGDRERILVNDLIAGVELRHDEVDGGSVGQHAMAVGIPIRLSPRKRRQETVMQIKDPAAREFPADRRR